MIEVTSNRRCYVLGCRVHHGTIGLVLAIAGAFLAWHDRADRTIWLRFRDR